MTGLTVWTPCLTCSDAAYCRIPEVMGLQRQKVTTCSHSDVGGRRVWTKDLNAHSLVSVVHSGVVIGQDGSFHV